MVLEKGKLWCFATPKNIPKEYSVSLQVYRIDCAFNSGIRYGYLSKNYIFRENKDPILVFFLLRLLIYNNLSAQHQFN